MDCTTSGTDLKGPYVQGRPGQRFIHLSWGTVDGTNTFTVFRRAKLMLDAVGPAVLTAAARSGWLVARLGVTDARGQPSCAAVRPPRVEWFAGAPI